MDEMTAEQAELAAVLDSFVYLDDYAADIEGGTLGEIIDGMNISAGDCEETPWQEYSQIKAALELHPEWREIRLIDKSSTNDTAQWTDDLIQAATFTDAEGNYYVTYRGTGEGRWSDNGDGMTAQSTEMQRAAADYFDRIAEKYLIDAPEEIFVIVSGHSKGGNESQFVNNAAEYEYLIDRCYSFDGQGFSENAIEAFKKAHGEEYYEAQLSRMYSICGTNDYVHDLGYVIIPEENTYYLETVGSGLTDWHHISNMLGTEKNGDDVIYTGLNWTRDETGAIVNGEQGNIGRFSAQMSRKMMELDEEDLHGTAVAMMWAIDYFFMAEDRGSWRQLGTVDVTAGDFVDLLAHGLPAITESVLATEEGQALIGGLLDDLFSSSYEKGGIFGVVGAAAVSAAALLPLAGIADVLIDLTAASKSVEVISTVCGWLGDLASGAADIAEKVWDGAFELAETVAAGIVSISPGGSYAVTNVIIRVDTLALREESDRLFALHEKAESLAEMAEELYYSTGAGSIGSAANRIYSLAGIIKKSAVRLADTADEAEAAERRIIAQYGR